MVEYVCQCWPLSVGHSGVYVQFSRDKLPIINFFEYNLFLTEALNENISI